jgi:hypothetical protein
MSAAIKKNGETRLARLRPGRHVRHYSLIQAALQIKRASQHVSSIGIF